MQPFGNRLFILILFFTLKLETMKVILLFAALSLSVLYCIGQNDGDYLFNDTFLHTINITSVDTVALISGEEYQSVNIEIDGNTLSNVGFRKKGNISASHSNNKVPFKIKTNKYVDIQEFNGIKEFTLHNSYQDPTMMREKLTYDICADMGLYALRTSFTKVYIDGVYWGLYTIVEGKDEMYKQRFDNRDGYALESSDFGDMCYLGENIFDYEDFGYNKYELDNGDDFAAAMALFIEMLDDANNTPDATYMNVVPSIINITDFFKYQAINVYLLNMDSYIQFKGNQIYFYDNVNSKWQIIPWDFNASFSLWNTNNYTVSDYDVIPGSISGGCIAGKINDIPALKETYLNTICSLMNGVCSPEELKSRIDYFDAQISEAVYSDYRKEFSNTEYDQNIGYGYFVVNNEEVPALKTFAEDRYQKISADIEALNYNCMSSDYEIHDDFVSSVYPNPASDILTILTGDLTGGVAIEIFDIFGRQVFLSETCNEKNVLDISGFENGVYIIQFRQRGILKNSVKLVKK